MERRYWLKPDKTLWKRESRGVYVYCDGLRRVIRRNFTWLPEVRDSHNAAWRPAQTFASGSCHYTTLTVAQEYALKAQINPTSEQ